MAKIVTYLGRNGTGEGEAICAGHLPPFPVGEDRLIDDTYASRFGPLNGDDLAAFVCDVYNRGRRTPVFAMRDPDPPPTDPVIAEDAVTEPEPSPNPEFNPQFAEEEVING